jgi:uncharacterized protein (DUF305 family)
LGNCEGSRGKEENVDEGTRGATSAQIGAVAEQVPNSHLPPVTYQDLPDPLPLRKVLGPGVVSIGIGVSSGELIIWPFITSQIGLIFLWAAVIGVLMSKPVTGVAVGGMSFVVGQVTYATDESTTGSSASGDDTDSMMGSTMNGGTMMDRQMMGSFDEEKPFDLQFIDKMIPHHEGALMSSEHMISDSKRPEIRQLYESIQKTQSEQIEQMQEWRKEWYPDAEQPSGMMGAGQTGSMMGNEMMDHSIQDMMGGNALDTMFLRMMIPHYQMAVDMSEEALRKAEHPELRDLARKIRDEQSSEIELMWGYLDAT